MNIKLTKKAEEELLKLVAGEISKINFTEMAVGDGLYTVDETLADITALKSERIKTKLGNIYEELVGGSSQLFITSTFFNKDVETKFEIREVGIYAKDNATEEEYLYAYYLVAKDDMAIAIIQDKTTPQYIPISVNSKLSNIDEADITLIDDMLVVNQLEFKNYKIEAKKYVDDNIKTHTDNKLNPHAVSKAQVGLGNVDNTADSNKRVFRSLLLETLDSGGGRSHGDAHALKCQYNKDNDGFFKLFVDGHTTKVDVANVLLSSSFWSTGRFLVNETMFLPAGGTWYCMMFDKLTTGGLGIMSGLRAGGTSFISSGTYCIGVFAIRVA